MSSKNFFPYTDMIDKKTIRYLNINHICDIHPASNTVLINGIYGDGNGLIRLSTKDMQTLMRVINHQIINTNYLLPF